MSKFNLSLIVSLALIVPSGATAIHLAAQPDLTQAQMQLLETSLKICYASSATLSGVLATQHPPQKKGQSTDSTNRSNS